MDRTLRMTKKLAAASVAGVLLSTALPLGASADEPAPAPDSGGWSIDVTRPEDRLPLSAEAASKIEAALQSYVAAPTSRTLDVTQVAQSTSYYCGPASAYMILEQQGFTSSQDGLGRTLSQANLAGADYLQTELNEATTWKSKAMASGINRWNGGSWSYEQVQSPSGATAQGAFTSTVGKNGRAIAADTVEFANQAHYNGHPSDRTIGHWIVGYEDSGATSYWADPSTSYYPSAAETFQVGTSSFAATYMQANGIMY